MSLPTPPTPRGYLFRTSGEVELIDLPLTSDELLNNPPWSGKIYLYHIEDDLFLLCHEDNDLTSYYLRTDLEINEALAKYFKNSPFVGDVLLLQIDEEDNILATEWPPVEHVLAPYQMSYGKGREPPNVDIRRVRRRYRGPSDELDAADPPSESEDDSDSEPSTSSEAESECERCSGPKWGNPHSLICRYMAVKHLLQRVYPDEVLSVNQQERLEEGLGWSVIRWANFAIDVFDVSAVVRVLVFILGPGEGTPELEDLRRTTAEIVGEKVTNKLFRRSLDRLELSLLGVVCRWRNEGAVPRERESRDLVVKRFVSELRAASEEE